MFIAEQLMKPEPYWQRLPEYETLQIIGTWKDSSSLSGGPSSSNWRHAASAFLIAPGSTLMEELNYPWFSWSYTAKEVHFASDPY